MRRFLVRRFLFILLSAFTVTIVVFTLSRTMGDPLLLYAKEGYGRTPEQMDALREYLGLNRPLVVQYFMWLGNALTGDLGNSLVDRRPVTRLLLERAPATIQLAIAGWALATIVGIPLGVLSSVKRATIWDYLGRTFALFGQATPAFWFGIVAILIFSVMLGWLPTSTRPTDVPLTTQLKHFILPTVVLAWGPAAGYLRLTRSAMLEVLDSEYIKLARAKGVTSWAVIWKHAFKNALIPPVTVSVLLLAGYLNGATVVELIFAWPGLGRLALDSLYNNDFPLLTGSVLMITLLVPDRLLHLRHHLRHSRSQNQVELGMATTEADLFARQEASETFGSKIWYVARRWPVVPIFILAVLLIAAIFAPALAPHDPIKQNLRSRLAPPAWAEEGTTTNLLGADHVGRDILSRIVHGARISVTVVVIGLTAGTLLGSAIGILSGYYGGIVDEIVMFVVVVWIGVPFLMIALIVVSITGPSFGVVMTLLILNAWTGFVRNVRAEVLSLKERDYVALARVAGASTPRIIIKHILPGVANTIVVLATLGLRDVHTHRGHTQLPRRRYPASDSRMGGHDCRGKQLPGRLLVDSGLPWSGYSAGRHVAQLRRRLAARQVGPPAKAA